MRSPDLLGALLVDRHAAVPTMGLARPARPVPGRGLARFGADMTEAGLKAKVAEVQGKISSLNNFAGFVDAAQKAVDAFVIEAGLPQWFRTESPSLRTRIKTEADGYKADLSKAAEGGDKSFMDGLGAVFGVLGKIKNSSYAQEGSTPKTVALINALDARKVKVAQDTLIYDPQKPAGTGGAFFQSLGFMKIPQSESYYTAYERIKNLKPISTMQFPAAAAAPAATAPTAAAPSIPAYTMPAAAAAPATYTPTEGPAPGTELPPPAAGDRPAWLLPALIATAAAGVALIALPIGATATPVTPIRQTGSRARNLDYGSVTSDAREGRMIRGTLRNLESDARAMRQMLEDDDDLPQWIHSKVQTSADRVNSAHRYLRAKIQASK
jgi:hypothetical protein